MGKKKKKKKKQQDWTTQLKFELSGIAIVMLALIATFNFGSVGTILIQLFRFFCRGMVSLYHLLVVFVCAHVNF